MIYHITKTTTIKTFLKLCSEKNNNCPLKQSDANCSKVAEWVLKDSSFGYYYAVM